MDAPNKARSVTPFFYFFNGGQVIKRIRLYAIVLSSALVCAAVPVIAREAERSETAVKWFEKMDMAFGATGIIQGAEGMPKTSENTKADVSAYSHSLDLELSAPVPEGGKVYFHFEAGSGEGVDPKAPTMSPSTATPTGTPPCARPSCGMNGAGWTGVFA